MLINITVQYILMVVFFGFISVSEAVTKKPGWQQKNTSNNQCHGSGLTEYGTQKTLVIGMQSKSLLLDLTDACFITTSALQKKQNKNRVVFVDTSQGFTADRSATRLLKMPLQSIKNRKFLKYRPLVLVGNGYQYAELLNTCHSLIKQHFQSVNVLLDQKSSSDLSANNMYQMLKERNWLLLYPEATKKDNSFSIKPIHGSIAYYKDDAEAISQVKSFVDSGAWSGRFNAILIAAGNQNLYEIIKDSEDTPVYMLNGGIEEYRDYLKRQRTVKISRQTIGQRELSCNG